MPKITQEMREQQEAYARLYGCAIAKGANVSQKTMFNRTKDDIIKEASDLPVLSFNKPETMENGRKIVTLTPGT